MAIWCEVAVVGGATAALQTPDIDGYLAAMTNFRFLASTVWTTTQAKNPMTLAAANQASLRCFKSQALTMYRSSTGTSY